MKTEKMIKNNEVNNGHIKIDETHTEVHHWPHIPAMQWKKIFGSNYVSTTTFTTFLFLIIVIIFSIIWNKALKSKKTSKIKLFFITYIKYADEYLRDSFWNREDSRKYFSLIIWFFSIILFWNLFWLIIDWFWSSVSIGILDYLRPMHSDLNTTLILAIITIFTLLFIEVKTHSASKTLKNYLFNFSWNSIIERCVNVFVGWLHIISIPSAMMSLSLRLFGNIFAWIVLISVIWYLSALATESFFEIWRLMSIPFWFFEVFVAFVQALVFAWLMVAYFKNAKAEH